MFNATRIAANGVAEKLAAAEAAIDAAIAAVANLTASMPAAAADAGLGIHTAQQPLMHAIESCGQLVKARTNIIRTHSALRTVQDDAGLGQVDFAPMGINQCSSPLATREAVPAHRLSVVAA
jgi:hypothetical protein